MKILIKTHQSRDFSKDDYFFIEMNPAQAMDIMDKRTKCRDFLVALKDKFGCVELKSILNISCGRYSFDDIPDGHYEKELDEQGWTDITQFLSGEDIQWDQEARMMCVSLSFSVGDPGSIYIKAIGKYSDNHIEAELYQEILDAVLKENVTTIVTNI